MKIDKERELERTKERDGDGAWQKLELLCQKIESQWFFSDYHSKAKVPIVPKLF